MEMNRTQHRAAGAVLALLMLASLGIIWPGLVGSAEASAAEWGVDDARTPTGDWDQLGVGESQWYAFQYAGDGSQVQVTLEERPGDR
jgi:hypothetical protein